MKKAYSISAIRHLKPIQTLAWDGAWQAAFGQPSQSEMWFITGPSASGKSSFVMQLAKKMAEFGEVLYVSKEEGVGLSFRTRLERYRMNEVAERFRVVVDDTLEDLHRRLEKKKSPKFIIVDSIQKAGWKYREFVKLSERFPKKSFVLISQENAGKPIGACALKLKYEAGVKIRTMGYRAFCEGRFISGTDAYFEIWKDGASRYWNKLKADEDNDTRDNDDTEDTSD